MDDRMSENARIQILIESFKRDFAILGERLDLSEKKNDRWRVEVTGRLDFLSSEIGVVKSDVKGLKADVAQLKTDVAELKTDVAELKADMADIKPRVVRIERHLGLPPRSRKASASVRRKRR